MATQHGHLQGNNLCYLASALTALQTAKPFQDLLEAQYAWQVPVLAAWKGLITATSNYLRAFSAKVSHNNYVLRVQMDGWYSTATTTEKGLPC